MNSAPGGLRTFAHAQGWFEGDKCPVSRLQTSLRHDAPVGSSLEPEVPAVALTPAPAPPAPDQIAPQPVGPAGAPIAVPVVKAMPPPILGPEAELPPADSVQARIQAVRAFDQAMGL